MTIETKYNIGDEAWIYLCEPIMARIYAVTIHEEYINYHVETIGRGRNNFTAAFSEEKLFPTKEALLKSL